MSDLSLFQHENKTEVSVSVETDEYTEYASQCFDYEFDGTSKFKLWGIPKISDDFIIGLIVGPSGSGKSSMLDEFGKEEEISWNRNKAIVSHFENPEVAIERLSAVGLNTTPSWMRPYHVLSTGEKFRADLARRMKDNAVIDEFTSVVDRVVAKAVSRSLRRFVDRSDINKIVIASCHRDILEWLQPDWVFDTLDGSYAQGRWLRRPKITITIYRGTTSLWTFFAQHHYLSNEVSKAARCYGAVWEDTLIGFSSSLPLPSGTVKNAYREHRTVILPDYQGLGVGPRLSDAIAQLHIDEGKRYYSRTAHPRLGGYRNESKKWRATSSSGKIVSKQGKFDNWKLDTRICYSHEYIGEKTNERKDLQGDDRA